MVLRTEGLGCDVAFCTKLSNEYSKKVIYLKKTLSKQTVEDFRKMCLRNSEDKKIDQAEYFKFSDLYIQNKKKQKTKKLRVFHVKCFR